MRRNRILFVEFVARMEDTRLPKCVMFGELGGGAGCFESQEKEWTRCLLDDLRGFGINADQDDCRSGRGGMAQNGRTRGGTFHGESDCCRQSQGRTTACSIYRMSERDGKGQG